MKYYLLSAVVALGLVAGATVALAANSSPPAHGRGTDPSNLMQSADARQVAVLADGVVTTEEHDGALAATVACMRAAGLDASVDGNGVGVRGALGTSGDETIRKCGALHLDAVAAAWADQHRPDAAKKAAVAAETTSCFLAAGGKVSAQLLTSSEVEAILRNGSEDRAQALGNCLQANMNKYGFAF